MVEMDASIAYMLLAKEHTLAVGCEGNKQILVYDLQLRKKIAAMNNWDPVSTLATWRNMLFTANWDVLRAYNLRTYAADERFLDADVLIHYWEHLRIVIYGDLLIGWGDGSSKVVVYDLAARKRRDELLFQEKLLSEAGAVAQMMVHGGKLYCCCNDGFIYEVSF